MTKHQPPSAFCAEPSPASPTEFDAAAYIAEMRALGVEFTLLNRIGKSLEPCVVVRSGCADQAAVEAVERKWVALAPAKVTPDKSDTEKVQYLVSLQLEEELMFAWAFGLVGNDMAKGLDELRRIQAANVGIYATHARASNADPESLEAATAAAEIAADAGGHRYYYLLRHLWKRVPITSFDDVGRKACLAVEHGDYFDDPGENLRQEVMEQIAAFFEKAQARKWIAGARKAGLSVFPWHGSISNTDNRGVMTFGQDMDGQNDFSSASDRFRRRPASRAVDGLRKGIVFDALCEDFEVDPTDPAMCSKVNAKLRAAEAEGRPC